MTREEYSSKKPAVPRRKRKKTELTEKEKEKLKREQEAEKKKRALDKLNIEKFWNPQTPSKGVGSIFSDIAALGNLIERKSPYHLRVGAYPFLLNVPKDILLNMVESGRKGSVVYDANPEDLVTKIFPPETLPVNINRLYSALSKPTKKNTVALINPKSVDNKFVFFPVFSKTSISSQESPSREHHIAAFFQEICSAAEPYFNKKKKPKIRRHWTGRFGSLPPRTANAPLQRKPDLLAIKSEMLYIDIFSKAERLFHGQIDVSGEHKTYPVTSEVYMVHIAPGNSVKTYCTMEAQDDRRFFTNFTVTHHDIRFTISDPGGEIHSRPINIDENPKLFLHLLIGLTYGDDVQLGYDPTITKEWDGSRYITIKGLKYKIKRLAFRSLSVQGRATICWIVTIDGKDYAVKQSWVVLSRLDDEVRLLQYAKQAKVKNVATIVDFEDVMVNGVLDSCENNRGVYKKLSERVNRRIIFEETGLPLWYFSSLLEFFSALRDGVKAHYDLRYKAKILHRDISMLNLLLADGIHPRKGLLVDLGYALDVDPNRALSQTGKENVMPIPMTRTKSDRGSGKGIRTRASYKKEREDQAGNKEIEVESRKRTGTFVFMSHEILIDKNTRHEVRHDLDSFFYMVLFAAVLFVGPGEQRKKDIPWFIRDWLKTTSETRLGWDKRNMIYTEDSHFEEFFLSSVTPYFEAAGVKPMLRVLRNAIKKATITHTLFLKELRTLIKNLKPEEPVIHKDVNEVKKSPMQQVLEEADFEDVEQANKFTELHGRGPPTSGVFGKMASDPLPRTGTGAPLPTNVDSESDVGNDTFGEILERRKKKAAGMERGVISALTFQLDGLTLRGGSRDDSFV